jgi:hypothetical protein
VAVSIAIQTHLARLDIAHELRACVGDAEIVEDPAPGGPPSPWRTYRRALEGTVGVAPGTTHRLIVQDDVILCDYFVEAVEAAALARPDRVLVFFVAGSPPTHVASMRHARARGWTWTELDGRHTTWCPVVAAAWPVPLVAPMLQWVDEQRYPPAFTADDEIAGRFLRAAGIQALASVPSLVEHPDTVTSLASGGRKNWGGLDPGRIAAMWIGDEGCDPRGLDWTLGPG